MLFLHCFPGGRDVGRRETAAHAEGQASEHERSVAIAEGNRTSRVAAEPSAAGCAPEPGCFITAEPLRTDRPGDNATLCLHLAGAQSRVDLPDVAATGAPATYV
jgi:hypothetical protein